MSVDFQAITQLLRADPTTDTINHDAYTVTMRVYMTTDSATTNNILNIETDDSQMHQLYTDGNNTSWKVGHSLKTTSATLGTGNTGEWISIALVGAINGSSQKVLRGYLRNVGGATQSVEHVHGHQTADELNMVLLNGWNYNNATNGLCKVADFKIWSSALTQTQIEAEWDSAAPVITSGLICHNDFGGANIGEALSSTTSNQTGFDTWVSTDSSNNTSAVDPVWSSDNPTYEAAGATLSGTVAMPDDEPTTSIDVERFAINGVSNGASVTATFAVVPTEGRSLVAFAGGWMGSATDIVLSDPFGVGWQKLGLQKITGSNIWLGAWKGTMVAGTEATMAVTATPNVSTQNWITLCVSEVKEGYTARLVDVALTFNEGTNTAPTVDLASTTNSKTLVLGAAACLSSQNAFSAATDWTMLAKKDGEGALGVIRRYASTAGNYDPTFALAESDSWICCGLALTADPPDVAETSPFVTAVSVLPATANLVGGETQQFTASVTGEGPYSTAVTWSLEQGDGILSSSGLYYAPTTATTAVIRAKSDMSPAVFGNATASVSVVVLPDVDDTGRVVSSWKQKGGSPLAGYSLDYWIISAADALITSGTAVTDSNGAFSVTVPEQYIGQSVLVVINNLGSDMGTAGKINGQQVVTVG